MPHLLARAHDHPLSGRQLPLPVELLGADAGVGDRDHGGVGQAGDEEGVVAAGHADGLVQGRGEVQAAAGGESLKKRRAKEKGDK